MWKMVDISLFMIHNSSLLWVFSFLDIWPEADEFLNFFLLDPAKGRPDLDFNIFQGLEALEILGVF